MDTRRLATAAAGGAVLVGTLTGALRQALIFYEMFYSMPKEKYGVLTPLRWQDMTALVVFSLFIAGLGYLSYRLLRYAIQS